ncbi:hypothetical protein [Xenorhabdus lircayensis]|uniref:Uncharacterized protein n=1 Tax=Xenorhabdus lircayensis TaxID=2763499 RepID=A0ABS0U1D2_9GAMM|nr:hypothetical protein [Xenorhabdus lircayensis]MBI6547269.1 hypothetical protein [Xenorhabdus lircayensis]
MRTEHTRSIQTISHSTEIIDSFFDEPSQKKFSVRRLSCRNDIKRQLFIVTIKDDNKSDDFYVVPFAELIFRREKVKYIISPENQYPELSSNIDIIMEHIESIVKGFIDNYKITTTH